MYTLKIILIIFIISNIGVNTIHAKQKFAIQEGEAICAKIEKLIKEKNWIALQPFFSDMVTIFVSADGPEITFMKQHESYSLKPQLSLRAALFEDSAMKKMQIKTPSILNMLSNSKKRVIYWTPEENEVDSKFVTSSTMLLHDTNKNGFAIYFQNIRGKWLITGIGVQEFLVD